MKRTRTNIISVLAAAVTVCSMCIPVGASAVYGENLLTNPDAANGFKGWKGTGKAWSAAESYNDIEAYDGKFFMPKKVKLKKGESTSIYQDIPVKDYVGKEAQLRGYIHTADGKEGDHLSLNVEFLDKSGKSVGSNGTGSGLANSWRTCAVYTEIPKNAVTARISLDVRYDAGDYADGCFDDIFFAIDGVKRSDLFPEDTQKRRSYFIKKGTVINVSDVFPDAGKGKVKWSTSDKSIVSVDSSGNITAKEYGTAVVTAKCGKEKVKIKVDVDW
ncbi:MAG: Ig-like domain-containing protein [Oscillospiraceae bacterium]|nr:Ig-like domain-containing protein [Oscillospiraceae bacterium]